MTVPVIGYKYSFSALQRAEIAEIDVHQMTARPRTAVSVLFNEPKLLKYVAAWLACNRCSVFQCSSTSRNCWNKRMIDAYNHKILEFQCSSTSRNCWNYNKTAQSGIVPEFQCSSTSRNCWNERDLHIQGAIIDVSVLFNEPKLLKSKRALTQCRTRNVSVLFNEPKLLKYVTVLMQESR